jgi:hypothetical protein
VQLTVNPDRALREKLMRTQVGTRKNRTAGTSCQLYRESMSGLARTPSFALQPKDVLNAVWLQVLLEPF